MSAFEEAGEQMKLHDESMTLSDEQRGKLTRAQDILDYRFEDERLLLSAITHPSATEGKSVKYSYERLEFLGDSILGAIVAATAFHRFHDLDEDVYKRQVYNRV